MKEKVFNAFQKLAVLRLNKNLQLYPFRFSNGNHHQLQKKVLSGLLSQSKDTLFGRQYQFDEILSSENSIESFTQKVPLQTYATQKEWWSKCLAGENDVVAPGEIKYFALSSGTADGSSKFIPVSDYQLAQFKRQSIRFSFFMAANNGIPLSTFAKQNLLIGGSSNLDFSGLNYQGDLSGILQLNIPFWYRSVSKPAAQYRSLLWEEKIEHIVTEAPKWRIAIITGLPSWIQLVLEKIIARHNLSNIHQIWPDLKIYIHSGIRAEPYVNSINKLFGQKVFWYESYLASEGFLAYQVSQQAKGMRLILDDGIFFEFVPFNEQNFDEAGCLKPSAEVKDISSVEEMVDYAIVITTGSGAWRYLLGDTVRFVDREKAEIVVTGRTSHFLSVVGEHLSIDNMNQAVQYLSNKFKFDCKEFTVYAQLLQGQWCHIWNIGCDETIDTTGLLQALDEKLKELNDDYRTERMFALKNVFVSVIPNSVFYDFLEKRGKTGGQIKFPRVLKDAVLEDWQKHLAAVKI